MFGSSLNQSKPAGTGFGFGNAQQSGTSLFGQSQPQQSNSVFGTSNQNNQQQQPGGILSGFGQSQNAQTQQQQSGGLFSGLGQNTQQNQQMSNLFGAQNQYSQSQLQSQVGGGLFGGSMFGQANQQQQFPQLGQAALKQIDPREKSIPEQMLAVLEKWDSGNPNCAFKHYFYNKVGEEMAVYYRASPNEDQKAWDDALANKPGPGYIPVLCTGFAQMGERIKLQQRNLTGLNSRLHEINGALSKMMQIHETQTSLRALEARRKHVVLKQRCLALATKVQVLRNRGYALSGDEEVLKSKLMTLERQINDPGLGARGEEIWARMLVVEDRAKLLKTEIEKSGSIAPGMLDDELNRSAKKILEDYSIQLGHLKRELKTIVEDYEQWAKDQGVSDAKTKEVLRVDTQGTPMRFI